MTVTRGGGGQVFGCFRYFKWIQGGGAFVMRCSMLEPSMHMKGSLR